MIKDGRPENKCFYEMDPADYGTWWELEPDREDHTALYIWKHDSERPRRVASLRLARTKNDKWYCREASDDQTRKITIPSELTPEEAVAYAEVRAKLGAWDERKNSDVD